MCPPSGPHPAGPDLLGPPLSHLRTFPGSFDHADRLAEICGRYLGKGQQVAIEGRIQTRTWDDEKGARHWKTEVVASTVEMLSGRKKKDYAAESGADGLEAAALKPGAGEVSGVAADEPIPEELAA